QAEAVSGGQIDALTLRLLIAASVGLVIVLGIVRAVVGWRIHWFVITGYVLVILVTYAAPPEIVGLAYDSGGVTTNIVTVPLIAVQIYGMLVYRGATAASRAEVRVRTVEPVQIDGVGDVLAGLAGILNDVALLVVVVLLFQLVVLRRGIPRPARTTLGFVLVVVGLYAFVVGLKMGLLPLGRLLAEQLIARDLPVLILLFAFLVGFATTLAEPALIAIGEQAEEAAP